MTEYAFYFGMAMAIAGILLFGIGTFLFLALPSCLGMWTLSARVTTLEAKP